MLAKDATLDLPTIDGSPKYFSKQVVGVTPTMFTRVSFTIFGVFLLNNNDVLSLFNCCPEALSYNFDIV
jgi:hypothetical protein